MVRNSNSSTTWPPSNCFFHHSDFLWDIQTLFCSFVHRYRRETFTKYSESPWPGGSNYTSSLRPSGAEKLLVTSDGFMPQYIWRHHFLQAGGGLGVELWDTSAHMDYRNTNLWEFGENGRFFTTSCDPSMGNNLNCFFYMFHLKKDAKAGCLEKYQK